MGDQPTVVAVATRIRQDEAEAIDAAGFGLNRAENMRVLIRYALDHMDAIRPWYEDRAGQPVDPPPIESFTPA